MISVCHGLVVVERRCCHSSIVVSVSDLPLGASWVFTLTFVISVLPKQHSLTNGLPRLHGVVCHSQQYVSALAAAQTAQP